MSASAVLTHLREHEGEDITADELLEAGVAGSLKQAMTELARLARRGDRTGVRRTDGKTGRSMNGLHAPYRYESPRGARRRVLTIYGTAVGGNELLLNEETGELYELVLIGRKD